MNKEHLAYCGSPEWGDVVERHMIPWVTRGTEFGDRLLEVGPGPGLTTEFLRTMTEQLTAIELDTELAAALGERTAGSNVRVVNADATAMPFADGEFSAAICLTMLHHVPSVEMQDALLAEMARVVRPRGFVIGSDSLDSPEFRTFHEGDVCTPVDPVTLKPKLEGFGLVDVLVETNPYSLRFAARVPAAP